MKNRKPLTFRRLAFESLESRLPLAGDVFINISHGSMTIKGDDAANQLSIDLVAPGGAVAPGTFDIFGNDNEVFHVNGAAPVPNQHQVRISDVTKDIKLDLKGGNDNIGLTGLGADLALARNIDVKGGPGADRIDIQGGHLRGALSIDTSQGDLGADNDVVIIKNLDVAKTVAVATGRGKDSASLSQSSFHGNVTIKTGTEADFVNLFDNLVFDKNLTIDAGSASGASDSVQLNAVHVSGTTTITTGNGDDFVELENVVANRATIKTGVGNDRIDVAIANPVTANHASISLGAGNDTVNIGASTLTVLGPKKTKMAGGAGDDTINGEANVTAASLPFIIDPSKTGVEHVNP